MPHLVPASRAARAEGLGRWPGAFAPRFFLALVVGLVWLGPAWRDSRFGYMILVWDILALMIWAWDWFRLPRPQQLEVSRQWSQPVSLGESCPVKLEIRSESGIRFTASVEDEVPAAFSPQPSKVEIVVPPGRSGRS